MGERTHTEGVGTKKANALIWGAVAGILVACISVAGGLTDAPPSGNPLLDEPMRAGGAGFFFGWAAAMIKNWFGRNIHKP